LERSWAVRIEAEEVAAKAAHLYRLLLKLAWRRLEREVAAHLIPWR
jgi:hypothetical protein